MLKKIASSRSNKSSPKNTTNTTEESSSSSSPLNKLFTKPSSPLHKKTAASTSAQSISATNSSSASYNTANNDNEGDSTIVSMPTVLKKKTKAVAATTPAPAPTPVAKAAAPAVTTTAASPAPEPHYDVTQQIYSSIKDLWTWGKTVPYVEAVLSFTESVASQLLESTFHTTLPAIDVDVASPNLKKLDDTIVSPAVTTVWGVIRPAVEKGGEMIVEPVMKEVMPKIIDIMMKKDPDNSPNPEYTTAPVEN